MIKKFLQAAILVAAAWPWVAARSQQAKTTAPRQGRRQRTTGRSTPPSPPAANIRAICYNDADLARYRARMLQQELKRRAPCSARLRRRPRLREPVRRLPQQVPGRAGANARSLQQLGRRKRFNVDVVVTEFANRTAQRAPIDKEFCAAPSAPSNGRSIAQVDLARQVPPPYDLGPEMNVHPCPASSSGVARHRKGGPAGRPSFVRMCCAVPPGRGPPSRSRDGREVASRSTAAIARLHLHPVRAGRPRAARDARAAGASTART